MCDLGPSRVPLQGCAHLCFPGCPCFRSLRSLRPGSCVAQPRGRGGRCGWGHLLEEAPREESAESALRAPVPLFIPMRDFPPPSQPRPTLKKCLPPPHSKSPSQHPPLSWKLLSKKVVKMIKCKQIFSSFSTLIKNGLSIQRKLEMK